jgi:tRNA pseudouridine38-40 synthase
MVAKLTISYDGTRFYGSQIQPSKDTVHGRLQLALKTLGINSIINFSGRTDKDVHASMQVVSFTLPPYWNDKIKLKHKLVSFMPMSIKIHNLEILDYEFHARFSAKKRSYRYLISKKQLTAFNSSYMAYYEHINIDLINQACKLFIGIHDFEYFHKKGSEPASTIREIYDIKFYEYKDIYVFKFTANSYLRSQIRMMVYALLEISNGSISLDDLKKQIDKKKIFTKRLASPYGLYLSKIYY